MLLLDHSAVFTAVNGVQRRCFKPLYLIYNTGCAITAGAAGAVRDPGEGATVILEYGVGPGAIACRIVYCSGGVFKGVTIVCWSKTGSIACKGEGCIVASIESMTTNA